MINERINRQIIDVWNKFCSNDEDLSPIFFHEFKNVGLLCIGLNPSFSEKGLKQVLQGTKYENLDVIELFSWKLSHSRPLDEYVNNLIDMEELAHLKYKIYFKPFEDISRHVGINYDQIDLFLYRRTSQKGFRDRIFLKNGLSDFAKAQLKIFLDNISLANPKVILVANALASDIVKDYFNKIINEFDNSTGYNSININGKYIPIFFSSMLSGGVLDKGSFERLKWHIKKTVESLNTPQLA